MPHLLRSPDALLGHEEPTLCGPHAPSTYVECFGNVIARTINNLPRFVLITRGRPCGLHWDGRHPMTDSALDAQRPRSRAREALCDLLIEQIRRDDTPAPA